MRTIRYNDVYSMTIGSAKHYSESIETLFMIFLEDAKGRVDVSKGQHRCGYFDEVDGEYVYVSYK